MMFKIITLLLLHGLVYAQDKLVTSEGCGQDKGCYMMPADCSDMDNCDVMVTWKPAGDSITFELLGRLRPENQEELLAIGFSKDENMGDDDVWACYTNPANIPASVDYTHIYNNGYQPTRLTIASGTVTDFEGAVVNSVMQCRFTRPKAVNVDGSPTFDFSEKYTLLIARNPVIEMNGVVYPSKHRVLPIITGNKIDFQAISVESAVAKRPILLKCHASLMLFGWIGCASIAIMVAKHFKIIWPNSKLCGEKIWFAVHRFFNVINVLCFVAGFVIIFVHVGSFVEYQNMSQSIFIHAACGISTTALGLTNPIMAIMRPHPGTKRRPYFNWAHWCVGMAAFILAIACVFIGIDLEQLDLPEYAFWVMVGFVLFHVVIDVLLKLVIGYAANEVQRKQGEQYEMQERKRDSVRELIADDKPTPPGSGVAMLLLVVHAFGVMGVAGTLVITIALM